MSEPLFFHVRLRERGGLAELTSVLNRFTPLVQPLAPSAAIAQVGGSLRLFGVGAVDLAQRIRFQTAALYGLGVAVGAGPSWTTATMASARIGDRGVRYVARSEVARFLGPLPISELYGIRRAQAGGLSRLGVATIGQLAELPAVTAARILGRAGRALQERARGVDRRIVVAGHVSRSVSVRTDFAMDVLDGPQMRAASLRLSAELGALLRSRRQAARALTLVVRLADGQDVTKFRSLPAASAHTDDLRQTVSSVLDGFGLQRARIRRVALTAQVVDAVHAHTQLTLDQGREARLRVEPVMDALNARFGPGTVGLAAAFSA
ncbi:hypothetical protein ACFO9E_05670 [Streptomyces maoxianensis]|uniref:UmuC domain-containing protein n=1 Tax=Streptomyces maoxianensis TaxID=1459942 RepID=A0ABV9G071_9ACTN